MDDRIQVIAVDGTHAHAVRDHLSDTAAMDRIHAYLDGTEWDSGTIEYVAEMVERTGREIRDAMVIAPGTVCEHCRDDDATVHLDETHDHGYPAGPADLCLGCAEKDARAQRAIDAPLCPHCGDSSAQYPVNCAYPWCHEVA